MAATGEDKAEAEQEEDLVAELEEEEECDEGAEQAAGEKRYGSFYPFL
jgi:hypothetical protein